MKTGRTRYVRKGQATQSIDYTMQQSIMNLRRQLTPEELGVIDRQLETERKSSGLIAILATLGLIGIAGVHRFVLGEVGKGILMLLTLGGLGVLTIVDLVRATSFATRYNLDLEYRYLEAAVERRQSAERAELTAAA